MNTFIYGTEKFLMMKILFKRSDKYFDMQLVYYAKDSAGKWIYSKGFEQCHGILFPKLFFFFICRVDLTDLIVKKVIPIGLCHVDALIHAENFVKSDKNTRQLNMELRDAYIDYLGPRVHPAALNRVKELEYIQSVVASLVPHLLPPRYLSSK